MSHDQRPGKLRVVQDPAAAASRQSGPARIVDMPVEDGSEVRAPAPAVPPVAASKGGGMVKAILFLLACAGGGVLVAALRPFGLAA